MPRPRPVLAGTHWFLLRSFLFRLQLVQDPISGGEELASLSDMDMAVFEQVVLKV